MDVLSLIGILLAFVAIIGGNYLEGGHLGALANGPAALIVIGGTVGAALLQSPLSSFKRAMQILVWIIFPATRGPGRRRRPRGQLEPHRAQGGPAGPGRRGRCRTRQLRTQRPATAGGRRRAGSHPQHPRSDFYTQESRDINAAKVFESMGGYAPTIGIIGAVMGLIHVMGNLADPSQLGSGIAVAFVATIYGVASANLLLLPIASKLKSIAMRQSRYREMLLEGILSIAEGENPRSIELKLQGFMD
jgi:chemotaxis protein MotA